MGGVGSGRPRRRERAVCFEHPGSQVKADGTYTTTTGRKRRYRCFPVVGEPHTFSVGISDGPVGTPIGTTQWSLPPRCPEHPASHVVRNGLYGRATPKRRQRYRCYPDPSDRGVHHSFTPPLPRDHVHESGEVCVHCDELRGLHRGETAVARRHSWSTRIVASALDRLSRGETYADVSRWALRATNTVRTRRPHPAEHDGKDPAGAAAYRARSAKKAGVPRETGGEKTSQKKKKRPPSPTTVERRNAWHIAADWVEAFAPVLYEPAERELREAALAERSRLDAALAAGETLERPQVLLIDDVPVYGRQLDRVLRRSRPRRDAGFFVLVAAETHWGDAGPITRLRLARAMAKSNTPAWRLVFDELGYDPDFLVADAGTGIAAAFAAHFDPSRTCFVPSLWHLRNRIQGALAGTPGAFTTTRRGPEVIEPLRRHLALLSRDSGVLATTSAWETWWDDLDTIVARNRLPVDKIRTQRRNNEARMAHAISRLAAQPDVPVSTGGLESIITRRIGPMLAGRRHAFANLERTNLLFDLVVAREHGVFDDLGSVVTALRHDTASKGGWTVSLRSIADARPEGGSYSSLRDTTLLADIAADRGLA